ncbi:MFS transporter [Streptomyces spinoverrucosus]|uniref:MFS transporter n=1 Tax=Streptomyces spinoverrucosus TaxID=284043 RepID=UPI0018C43D98|nr:MFS transporter [Streptomyces spinoverrucosus]MBG0857084.1 MFS transporter [Streptomyces spinoverrucosus]
MSQSTVGTARARGTRGAHRRHSDARHHTGFWLIAATFTLTMAFSTVPTPLYPLYQRTDGFGPFVVTIVFATYAVGVLAALFLAGHLSDWLGRRTVLLPAVALSIASAMVFVSWYSVPALIVARLLSGLSVGLLTATATAHLDDLHRHARPHASPVRANVVATGANLGGLGIGPLVSGLLADHAPDALRTPYLIFLGLLALAAVAVVVVPETVVRPEPRPRYRPQRVSVPDRARPAFFAVAGAGLVTFAVLGLFTSLTPLVLGDLHVASPTVTGLAAFLVFGSAALAQILLARAGTRTQLQAGLGLLAVGMAVLAAAVWTADLPLFLVGGAVSGAGAGTAFKGCVSTVLSMAVPERRGETLTGLFLAAYAGLSVPVLGLGLAVQTVPVRDAVLAFSGLVAALAVLLARRFARSSLSG